MDNLWLDLCEITSGTVLLGDFGHSFEDINFYADTTDSDTTSQISLFTRSPKSTLGPTSP